MRKLLLPALAACSLLAVGVPAASAHKAHTASKAHVSSNLGKKLSKARGAILGLQKTVKQLGDINLGQTAAINRNGDSITSLGGQVQFILSNVPAILDGLNKLGAGLTAAGAGLTAIQTALADPTTGLVGLNLIRPQYGAFNANGTIIGGTGQTTGASGPKTDSIHAQTGTYVVNFGNDVSNRALSVNPFPGSTAPIGQAVDCASNSTATTTCNALNGGALTSPQNYVLVTIEDHSGTQCVRNLGNSTPGSCNSGGDFVAGTITSANQPFSVMAIHG